MSNDYIKLVEEYRIIIDKIKKLEEEKEKLRQRGAELLHQDKINRKEIQLPDGENWLCGYQTTTKTSTDLKLLLEYVGPAKYSEIVTEKESTFLTIRKLGKSKTKDNLTTQKPVEEENEPLIPSGVILT